MTVAAQASEEPVINAGDDLTCRTEAAHTGLLPILPECDKARGGETILVLPACLVKDYPEDGVCAVEGEDLRMGMAVLVHKEAAFQPAPDVGQEVGIHVTQVAPEGFPAVDVDLERKVPAFRRSEPESYGVQVADLLFELVKRLLYGLCPVREKRKESGRHGNRGVSPRSLSLRV